MNIRKIVTGMMSVLAMTVMLSSARAGVNSGIVPSGVPFLTSSGAIVPTVAGHGPSGTFTESVYNNNPSGFLTFVFQVTQTTGPDGSTGGAGFNNFDFGVLAPGISSVFTYDGTGASAPLPLSASRTATSTATFAYATVDSVGMVSAGTPLSTGQTTGLMIITTNAKNLSFGTAAANNSGVHAFGGTIYGATLAPEPASFAVFGFIGLGVLGLVARARRGKVQMAA